MPYNCCVIFMLLFSVLMFNLLFFVISYDDNEKIDMYIKAIEKTWKNYPILDISLTRKNGYKEIILLDLKDINIICDCSHIEEFKLQYKGYCSDYKLELGCNEYNPKNRASKIYGTKLYVSYYEADYLTLFKRLRNDKGELNSKLCKDEYKRCGYLDLLNNTLCVKEEEICPINNISFNLFGNGTIKEIITDNTKKDSYIINRLIASEMNSPNIFDINKFSPLYNDKHDYFEDHFSLSKITIPKVIKKSDFFEDNELMKGKAPYDFENKNMQLFHLLYPGMNVKYPIKFISLIKHCSIIGFIHLSLEIGILIIIIIQTKNLKKNKLVIIINIIIIIILLAFLLLNIFIFIALYYLYENLISMNISLFGYLSRVFELIYFIIIDFTLVIVIIFISILIYKEKDDNNIDDSLLVN